MMFWLFLVGGLSLPWKQLGVIANQALLQSVMNAVVTHWNSDSFS
jgi:hypothetical protein